SQCAKLAGQILKGTLKATIRVDLDGDSKSDGNISGGIPKIELPDYLKINFNVKEDELKVLLEIIDSLYFVFKTKIIANKIEDQNIFKKLMDSKRISYFQGFHFSKVLNTKEIITYLDKGWLYEF
ncbi:MAG: hypothetical protein ACK42K_12410, partial [Leptonema sp. (in: bacteria)]